MRLTLLAALWLALSPVAGARESVVVLVRHAEKVDDSCDPELSDAGKARARALAEILRDLELDAVYSTDFIRTRETARPIAEALALELLIYDGANLEPLAEHLRAAGGRVLVVGHSNTTPEMVRLLGGDPGAPIPEDEYDRLYFVVGAGEMPSTILLRFSP